MKSHLIFCLVIQSLFFFSCAEDKVKFEEPQPAGVKSDAKIREKFRGNFFSSEDSTWLVVREDKIWISSQNPDASNSNPSGHLKSKVNANGSFGADSSVNISIKVNHDQLADSFSIEGKFEEFIYDKTKGSEARMFKGFYFLNKPVENGMGYKVRVLKMNAEGLALCRIASDSVLHLLENEEFVKKDGNGNDEENEENWKLKPSRKELKKLLKMGLFSNVRLYKKQEFLKQ